MMKKITALLLAMVMVFALCACGNNSDDKKTDDNADASKIKVGFIFLHDENSTYDLNFMNAAEAACKNLGLDESQYVFKKNMLQQAATSSSPTASATSPSS